MRWLVTLQVALGLGALFGLAYKSVDVVVEPIISAYAETAAQAEARAAAAHLEREWGDLLEEQHSVVRELAATEAFASRGAIFGRNQTRGLGLALEAAIAESGGQGRAAVIGLDAAPLVESEGSPLLAGTFAAQAALSGTGGVRLEALEGVPHIVAAAPLVQNDDRGGALIIATPLDVARLRELTQVLPAGTLVAITLNDKPVVHTARAPGLEGTLGKQALLTVGEEAHAVAQRPGGGGEVHVVGLARVRGDGARAAVEQVRWLVLVLGGLGFLVVAVILMVAPSESAPAPAAVAHPVVPVPAPAPAPAPIPAPAVSLPTAPSPPPVAAAPPPSAEAPLRFPEHPTNSGQAAHPLTTNDMLGGPPPSREGEPSLDVAFGNKTVPNAGSAGPPLSALGEMSSPSQDLKAPVGGERSPFAKTPAAPPPPVEARPAPAPAPAPKPAPPPAPFSSPPPADPLQVPSGRRQSAIITNPPPSSNEVPAPSFSSPPRPPATPAASPFDAIANAAVSRPPPAAPPPPQMPAAPGSGEDLPAPKGGVPPEMMAAERAQQQRAAHARPMPAPSPSGSNFGATPYDPELPAPKGRSAAYAAPEPAPSPATEPPRQPPGVTQPPMAGTPSPAIPLPPATAPAPARNPWENPSVPAMKAPTAPPAPAAPAPAASRFPQNSPASSALPAMSAVPSPTPQASVPPYDESHYRSVYNEFVSSKAQLGEAVDNITYEGFRTKLRTSEQQLLERHGCRAVRFQVLVKDRTVSLRPQLVR